MVQKSSLPLQKALADTVAYSQVFGSYPSEQDLQRWLLSPRHFSRQDVRKAAEKLQLLFSAERASLRVRRSKWQEVVRAAQLLGIVPWIQGVWLTGSVAAGNISENDDLDFLIVTAPERLWITRVIVLGLTFLVGRRRPRLVDSRSQVANTWCWNMWQEIQSVPQAFSPSVYTARELVQARLLWVRQGVSPTLLLDAAPWVQHYTAHGWSWARASACKRSKQVSHTESRWISVIFSGINFLLFRAQLWFMQPHRSHEKVQYDQAWFHPEEKEPKISRRYETMQSQWRKKILSPRSKTGQTTGHRKSAPAGKT